MSRAAVLLVDDEKTVLDSLRGQVRAMVDSGVVCEIAESVDEAWEVLDELLDDEQVNVVLVVSDWLMPRVNGDRFLRDLAARHPGITRVLLTGHVNHDELHRAKADAIPHRVLFKPWREADLRETLDQVFS